MAFIDPFSYLLALGQERWLFTLYFIIELKVNEKCLTLNSNIKTAESKIEKNPIHEENK